DWNTTLACFVAILIVSVCVCVPGGGVSCLTCPPVPGSVSHAAAVGHLQEGSASPAHLHHLRPGLLLLHRLPGAALHGPPGRPPVLHLTGHAPSPPPPGRRPPSCCLSGLSEDWRCLDGGRWAQVGQVSSGGPR
ncbi:unnamed protein product, partial [Tetraodon nigroviridis]